MLPSRRTLGAMLSAGLGVGLYLLVLVVLSRSARLDPEELPEPTQSFQVRKDRPTPTRRPRPRPRKRPRPSPAPPAPRLGASLSGLSFGIQSLQGLGAVDEALLGELRSVVMTEDSVDMAPEPLSRQAAPYPARARQRGIEGYVHMSLLVTHEGRVEHVEVVESQPPGVFDQAALQAIRQWRFAPATYEGAAVTVRVDQTLRFELQ